MKPTDQSPLPEARMEATKSPRLGRGINALLGDLPPLPDVPEAPPTRVPVAKVAPNPLQPRKQFDPEELASLTESIKTHGVLQPLLVRAAKDGYQLIAGERRLRAAQAAGLTEVPVHVVTFDDQQMFEAALVENIHRADLNPIEKAQGFKDYLDRFQMKHDELAARIGLDRTSLSNLLSLLHLEGEVQEAIKTGQLSLGHAKVLKSVWEPEKQVAFAKEAVMKNYSVHALDALVKQWRLGAAAAPAEAPPAPKPPPFEKTAHVKGLEDELRQRLATKVEIRVKAKDKGLIVIGFDSNDDFERIMQALQK